jgi:hypothetical protein
MKATMKMQKARKMLLVLMLTEMTVNPVMVPETGWNTSGMSTINALHCNIHKEHKEYIEDRHPAASRLPTPPAAPTCQ